MDDNSRPQTSRPPTSQSLSSTSDIIGPQGPPPAPPMSARPVSRRRFGEPMTARQRPDSRMSAVSSVPEQSQQRPMSRVSTVSRLQSAARPASSFRQGSAMRAPSTARPPSGITGGNLPLHASVNVMDRPVTQQGVSGLRTARTSYGNRRMVHDKTYYLGLLHTKMSEMGTEINKLGTQVDALAKEQSTFIAYESRVKEKAAELQDLHGELQDYNILSEMIQSDKDKMYLEEELRTLKKDNATDSERIEMIYNRRREAEKQVSELEQKIEDERNKAHHLIESLNPQLRERYISFQTINNQLQGEMERLQTESDDLSSKKSELYDRISRSELKKKAAEMEEELLEAEEKRNALVKDSHSQETPEEERERLLSQVKSDNAEISTLERQIAEISDQIRQAQEEIHTMEQEIEETDSDRQQKFRELRKREQDMDEFMRNFDDSKAKEIENLTRIETEIVNCMERISRNVHLATTLPEAGQNFVEMREELDFKEEEFDKAKYTSEMIEYRNEALRKQLENFQNLEEKMKTELKTLTQRMDEMQKDLKKFQDIETVKVEGNERHRKLQLESVSLEQKTKIFGDAFRQLQQDYEKLKKELDSNDVHRQLTSMEKKWVLLEEANYSLSQFLQAKRAETDYEGVKEQALGILKDLNSMLQIK